MKLTWPRRHHALELDFLHPGARTLQRRVQLALLVCAIVVLALALTGYTRESQTLRERSAALDAAAQRPHARVASTGAASPEQRSRAASAVQFKTIQAQLNYPWQSLLALLESAHQDDVALLALEPDRRSGMTRLTAEAGSVAAMLNYLDELQKSGAFDDVVLASHERQVRRPGSPIRFELMAHWHSGYRLHAEPDTRAVPPSVTPVAPTEPPPLAATAHTMTATPIALAGAQGH
jgi:Tfp pilus assembly protein PilN